MKFVPVDFDPFDPEPTTSLYPTTDAQREIYTNIAFGGDEANCCYNESISLTLEGELNIDYLQRAINQTLANHEALRCIFSEDGTTLSFMPHSELELTFIDLTNNNHEEQSKKYRELLLGEVTAPFDLINGPLIDFKLVKFSSSLHHLVITVHHIICDGWSIGIVMQDMASYYNSFAGEGNIASTGLVPFSEYIKYEQQLRHSALYEENIDYWKKILTPTLPSIDLPVDKTRPPVRTYKAERIDLKIPRELTEAIKKSARSINSSLVNYMICAFEIFLRKITGSDDIILGLPTAGQNAANMTRLVGHCVNLLPLRTHINDKETFHEYVKLRKAQMLNDLEHQQLTLGSLLAKMNIPRDLSRIPLTPVAFNIDIGIADGLEMTGLKTGFISNPRKFENFEIFFNITGNKGELIIENTFNSNLFSHEAMVLHTQEYLSLLNFVTTHGDSAIKNISLLSDDTINQFDLWNDTYHEFDTTLTLPRWFEATAGRFPDNIAIEHRGGLLTYSELNKRANILSRHLTSMGLLPGHFAAFCLDRSADMIVTMIAIQKAGAGYIPIDPDYPLERIQYMLHDSGCEILITHKHLRDAKGLGTMTMFFLDNDWYTGIPNEFNNPAIIPDSSVPAYIRYTSGSTGKPKGVLIRQVSVVNLINSFRRILNFSDKDKLLGVTTISFDISELEVFLPLMCGGTLYLASGTDAMDAEKLSEIIESGKITTMQATPATWRALMDSNWKGNKNLNILCGGEALPDDLAAYLVQHSKRALNVYGPTETTVWSTCYDLSQAFANSQNTVKLGRGIDNTLLYVLDSNLTRVPPGVEGEIYIGGVGLAAGYWNQPALTAERFIIDPFDFSGLTRIYKTGDRGKFDLNGNLIYSGRADLQVKVRGYRIETGEIENAINSFNYVSGSAVVTRTDSTGQNNLYAYVVPQLVVTGTKNEENKAASYTYTFQEVDDDYIKHLVEIKKFSHVQLRNILKYTAPGHIAVIGSDHVSLIAKANTLYHHYTAIVYDNDDLRNTRLFVDKNNLASVVTIERYDEFISNIGNHEKFDAIIVDGLSVLFKSAPDLLSFMSQLEAMLRANGQLVLLNVRSYALEYTRILFNQLELRAPETNIVRIVKMAEESAAAKKGLLLDPEYFEINKTNFARVKQTEYFSVDVPDSGESRYYFNVVCRLKEPVKYTGPIKIMNYKKDVINKQRINPLLSEHIHEVKVIREIPCDSLIQENEARNLVDLASGGSLLKDLKVLYKNHDEGVSYNELRKLAESREYYLKLNFNSMQRNARFDAIFIPNNVASQNSDFNIHNFENEILEEDSNFTNGANITDEQEFPWSELKNFLSTKLPSYMVPAHFMLLQEFPLTPAGKIDRKALPEINVVRQKNYSASTKLTSTEKKILPIWESLLAVKNLSTHDNFFDMGGHSLMAVKLVIEIEKATGQRMPLAILFSNPTIHALSQLIDSKNASQTGSNEVWNPITTIRDKGTNPPVFFAHGVSGNVFKYYALGKLLNEETPVYGLQAKGLNGTDEPFTNMELMAQYHVAEIINIQPHGPYYLGGGSFGGLLAYEIARQLLQKGKTIGMVALFDVEAARKTEFLNPVHKQIADLTIKSRRAVNRLRKIATSSIDDNLRYIKAKMSHEDRERDNLDELLKKRQLQNDYGDETATYFNALEDACYKAMNEYKVEPYDGKVTLFRARNTFYSLEYSEDLGWNFFAKEGTHIIWVDGDHNSIFEYPHVNGLAKELQRAIQVTYTQAQPSSK